VLALFILIKTLIALLMSFCAVGCIYWSWRQRGNWLLAFAGWLLVIVSMFSWSAVSGPEFGTTYALIAMACAAWLLVLSNRDAAGADSRAAERTLRLVQRPPGISVVKQGARFLLSVPVAGLLALMLSVALVLYLPWTLLTKIAVAIFLYPVLWGALSAWICAQEKIIKPAMAVGGLFLISSVMLFI
jgi:hypothetical protein